MQTTLNSYDPATRQVSVTFEHGGVSHTRFVNAVMSPSDKYDEHGTELRIIEVARGVEYNIDHGVITNPPPPPELPEAAPEPESETETEDQT